MNTNPVLKKPLLAALLCFASIARADWTPIARIEALNIGGNGLHGTFVSLSNVSFTGCGSTTALFIEGTGANYKELVASLLAAKIADKDVRLLYSVCSGGYWVVKEVVIP